MDENKNLNPEGEEKLPEENTSENTAPEEISDEVTETVKEEVTETAFEENAPLSPEAEELFAEVNDFPEPEEAPKKKKTGLFIGIGALIIVLIAAAAFLFLGRGSSSEGTGNLLSQGFAAVKGDYLYHVDFSDLKMHKTSLKTGEGEAVTDDYAVYISNYRGDIYYMGYKPADDGQSYVYEYKKFVDGKNDKVILSESVTSPQLTDGYLYYLKSVPEFHSGYSSRLYRVSLSGGEPETVCDALMISYLVDGKDLYYCDVETTSLVRVKLADSIKIAKETPLEDGAKRASDELGAEPVASSVVTCMAMSGNTLYYIDAQTGNYTLCTYDLKTGEQGVVNNGVTAATINIYGKFLYYYSTSDFSVYRMNLDGSNVTKITDPGYGYMILSGNRFISMEFSDDYKQYISVCDLDGNELMEIGLDSDDEEYYDDSAADETADEPAAEADSESDTDTDTDTDADTDAEPAA